MGKLKKDNADKAVRVEADGTIKLYGDTKPVENQQKSEIKELLKKAKKGDLAAQYRLSKYYFYGMCGLKKDSKKAVFWFEKYAERADSIKQWQIAVAYKSGKEIPQNYKKSVYWYTKAAEQGHVISQYDLGCFYYDGKIVAKDYEKAVYWFERAAEQESTNAMEKLAYCYKHGLGVEKSQTKADHYENLIFKITGKKPIPEQVKKPVTPTKELIGENRRTVYTLNPDIFLSELDKEKRLAESGDAEAQADLGFYYYHGFDDVKQDFEKAV
ncbi:MAG: sel1 repeat family protein, partial [Clostridia bacterium]|nr:sel1 repeat family protein [Clostridia bacterium]